MLTLWIAFLLGLIKMQNDTRYCIATDRKWRMMSINFKITITSEVKTETWVRDHAMESSLAKYSVLPICGLVTIIVFHTLLGKFL